jgi:hypothetical protein
VPIDKVEAVKHGIEQHKKLNALTEELAQAGLAIALHGDKEPADAKKKPASCCSPKRFQAKSQTSSPRPSKP